MPEDRKLKSKHAYVTGSSRGLGKALAEVLLEEGWSVTGIARTTAIAHGYYQHLPIDLSSAWQDWLPGIFQEHKPGSRLLLINNAGALGEVMYMGGLSPESLARVFALNVTAPALLMNEFLRQYPQQDKLVLNISSGAAQYPVDGWSAYCSSKSALDMLSEVAAHEAVLARKANVKVFSISPGVVDTAMQEQIRQTDKRSFSRVTYFQDLKKGKRLAEPQEVARQLMVLIDHPKEFKEVKQDVRKL